MAFITRYLARLSLLLLLAGGPLAALAAEAIVPRQAALELNDGALTLKSRYAIELNPTLLDALDQGVALTFRLEFELTKPRMYAYWRQLSDWFDPTASQSWRLSWHPLTRQYRVSTGTLFQSYTRLEDALALIGASRSWRVLGRDQVGHSRAGDFAGRLRLYLDTTQLPRPFQLNILKSSDWTLDSGWQAVAAEGGS